MLFSNIDVNVNCRLPEAQVSLEEFLKHAEPILGISPSQDVELQNSDMHTFLVPPQTSDSTSSEDSKSTR